MRFHAKEWQIDPHKIGVIGFSAGGHLVADVSNHFEKRLYRGVDDADKENSDRICIRYIRATCWKKQLKNLS